MSDLKGTKARFQAALDKLIDQVRQDRHILAGILCGSMSHDVVWDKSDIDLILICSDDKKTKSHSIALVSDDINIHTNVIPRIDFKRAIEGTSRNSFMHSLIVKSQLLFTTDPSINDIYHEIQRLGDYDRQIQLFKSAAAVTGSFYKAQKWAYVREDLDYASLYLLYAATSLAQIEVGFAREIISREVIPQALDLNPEFFRIVYTDLLNKKKTKKAVKQAIKAIDAYLSDKAMTVFKLLLDHLEAEGDVRSASDLDHHFNRAYGTGSVVMACEYLSDLGIIDKVSTPAKLTTRSQVNVEEMAFFYTGEDY
jgi:uncharacterized protein